MASVWGMVARLVGVFSCLVVLEREPKETEAVLGRKRQTRMDGSV